MIFNDYGIRLENDRGYTEWSWDKFSNYFESPNFIHLYFNSRSFFLVPKEAINEEGIMSEIRFVLSQKIKKK